MKQILLLLLCCHESLNFVAGFAPSTPVTRYPTTLVKAFDQQEDNEVSAEDRQLYEKFQSIAQKLRVSIHSNGFDSKDPKLGIERISATIPVDGGLGLVLTEVAHSATEQGRGLVLVSDIGGNAATTKVPIEVGDTIVSVGFTDESGASVMKEDAMGLDYEATMDVIIQAKSQAEEAMAGGASITLEFNRLVERKVVQVIIDGASSNGKPITVEGLAGDNLRQLLKRNKIETNNGPSCGGEGVCGTCKVDILEGEDSLNKLSSSSKKKKQGSLRKACQTVIGADNQEGTVRVSLSLPSE